MKSKFLSATKLLITLWLVHTLLRAFLLGRVSAMGLPFVSKFEWYIFHAVAIDYNWILPSFLPLLLLGAWLDISTSGPSLSILGHTKFPLWRRFKTDSKALVQIFNATQWITVFSHCIILLLTVSDHEVQRSFGCHLGIDFMNLYFNPSSMREVGKFFFQDASWWAIPYILFLGCIPTWWLIHRYLPIPNMRLRNVFVVLITLHVVFLCFRHVIWPGGFREKKLASVVYVFAEELKQKKTVLLSGEDFKTFSSIYQSKWLHEQNDNRWVFPDSNYPYVRQPRWLACESKKFLNDSLCQIDNDSDGYRLSKDCNDEASSIHQGAPEIASNGIDENCDGIDSLPWNVILIVLESHRAWFTGFLQPYGAAADATPYLNQLAPKSHIWTHFNVGGVPTISALMATHLSLIHHPSKYIATSFTQLSHQSFISVLGNKGYTTHYFTSADPSWDNQTPWLHQWYQGYTYDRSRESDGEMFRNMAGWMKTNLSNGKPFFVTAMTKTNHYPFNAVSEMGPHPSGSTLGDKMKRTMTYTEQSLKSLVDSISKEPWFDRTLLVVMADHGFSLGTHGSTDVGNGLYAEHTWIPLVIYGKHPKLGSPKSHHEPASQIDLGPTILDLLGVEQKTHAQGHSLLRQGADSLQNAIVLKSTEAMWAKGNWRWHGAFDPKNPRPLGEELFDSDHDRREEKDLSETHTDLMKQFSKDIQPLVRLHVSLIEQNKLWPIP